MSTSSASPSVSQPSRSSLEDDAEESTDGEYSGEEASSLTSADSNLQDMYESFEFEDEVVPSFSTKDNSPPSGTSRRDFDTRPLYPDARLTTVQSQLLIFQYSIRHSLTSKALTELMQLISVHLPQGATVPKSVYHLKQNFLKIFPDAESERHYFCECCQRPLTSLDVACVGDGCGGSSPATFITVPLGVQVKRMMEGWCSLICTIRRGNLGRRVIRDKACSEATM